jgi:hypothetical protein
VTWKQSKPWSVTEHTPPDDAVTICSGMRCPCYPRIAHNIQCAHEFCVAKKFELSGERTVCSFLSPKGQHKYVETCLSCALHHIEAGRTVVNPLLPSPKVKIAIFSNLHTTHMIGYKI